MFLTRADTVEVERSVFGRGRTGGWGRYWRLRSWNQVVGADILIAVGLPLLVLGLVGAMRLA
jgi:hypothetical protein